MIRVSAVEKVPGLTRGLKIYKAWGGISLIEIY